MENDQSVCLCCEPGLHGPHEPQGSLGLHGPYRPQGPRGPHCCMILVVLVIVLQSRLIKGKDDAEILFRVALTVIVLVTQLTSTSQYLSVLQVKWLVPFCLKLT